MGRQERAGRGGEGGGGMSVGELPLGMGRIASPQAEVRGWVGGGRGWVGEGGAWPACMCRGCVCVGRVDHHWRRLVMYKYNF